MFFHQLEQHSHAPAVIQDNQTYSYAQLVQASDQLAQKLGGSRKLLFIQTHNSFASLVAYLAALRGGHVAMMLDPSLPKESLANLCDLYQPNAILDELTVQTLNTSELKLDPRLSLLLSTSGSTGTAKQVALSAENVHANADAICQYLPILSRDTTVSTLPLFYSYGLSVINSHLLRGACILFTPHSAVNREFWEEMDRHKIASLAGVPHSYDMLLRLRFQQKALPSLRYFTQAGGKLGTNQAQLLADYASTNNKRFFIMYGQTEATARMAYLSPEKVSAKPDSIGQAIPGGRFELRDEEGNAINQANTQGELHYCGPNVMLGYAGQVDDVASFSPTHWLATGDLATRDEEGDYFIVGRLSRFIKVFGERVNLDDVEGMLAESGVDSYCCGQDNVLLVAIAKPQDATTIKPQLSKWLRIHASTIKILEVEALPINPNGKKDYVAIMDMAGLNHD